VVPKLLVVSHSRTGGTSELLDAVLAGIAEGGGDEVELRSLETTDAGPDDVEWADAVILGTPERFGYVAGLMKDFLERIYYPLLDRTRGKPWAMFVKAGNDGSGAVRSVQRIITGLGWREVQPPVVAVGDVTEAHLEAAFELGGSVAAGLAAGMF
jgi:multimeric flavodoxin WrbA